MTKGNLILNGMGVKMEKVSYKELIDELLRFLRSGKRQSISIEEYIELTSSMIQWTDKRKRSLYRALDRTNALSVTQTQHTKPMIVKDVEAHGNRKIDITYTRTLAAIL